MTGRLPTALIPYQQHYSAFGPDAAMPARLRRAKLLMLFLIVVIGGSMAMVPIGGAVIGSGQVGVQSRVKQISHPAGGIVTEILVENGQHVRRGQILVRLDDRVSSADARLSSLTVDQLLAQRARLEAERIGAAQLVVPPAMAKSDNPETVKAMADERRLFHIRRQEQAGIAAQLRDRLRQYERQIEGYRAQIASLDQQVKLVRPEQEGARKLWEKGLVTIARLNEVERTAADLGGNIGALQANIAQTEARISETREQIIHLAQTRRAEAGAQLAEVNATLNQQQLRSVSATDSRDRSTIRAPYDGIVDKLALATIGGVIKPADIIMEIVPDKDQLLVEAAIMPNDVDQLRPGQPVRIRFTGMNSTATPEIPGKLTFISAERTTDPSTHQGFYPVRVAIDPMALNRANMIALRPGMPAEIFVSTGHRTMLSYLTKPFRDQLERALRDN